MAEMLSMIKFQFGLGTVVSVGADRGISGTD
jgi:hypothetical protein